MTIISIAVTQCLGLLFYKLIQVSVTVWLTHAELNKLSEKWLFCSAAHKLELYAFVLLEKEKEKLDPYGWTQCHLTKKKNVFKMRKARECGPFMAKKICRFFFNSGQFKILVGITFLLLWNIVYRDTSILIFICHTISIHIIHHYSQPSFYVKVHNLTVADSIDSIY